MNILQRTEEIRKKAQEYGQYRDVAEKSGVGYEWLTKFASGKIKNPGVDKVSSLEDFFRDPSGSNRKQ
jgi:transcriptional regulator with XRE-family HTH domain